MVQEKIIGPDCRSLHGSAGAGKNGAVISQSQRLDTIIRRYLLNVPFPESLLAINPPPKAGPILP
jgi:hypothetical protein